MLGVPVNKGQRSSQDGLIPVPNVRDLSSAGLLDGGAL